MGFDVKYYAGADAEIKQRRLTNSRELDNRRESVAKRFPEYAKLRALLAETTAKITEAVISKTDVRAKIAAIEAENSAVNAKIAAFLEKGGYPKDYLDPIYSCDICKDTGIINGSRCDCFKKAVKRLAAEGINSNSPLTLTGFETFDIKLQPDEYEPSGRKIRAVMKKNFDYCKDYAENFHLSGGGILMLGETGLGKTHLSLAIAGRVLENGYSAVYGSAPDLFRKIENEHFGRSDGHTADSLQAADLLVLDDIGAEFDSSFYVSVFYNLLNSRMNAGLPLIISTNMDTSELKERYGERIFSRLMTMKIMMFCGKDIRQIKRGRK